MTHLKEAIANLTRDLEIADNEHTPVEAGRDDVRTVLARLELVETEYNQLRVEKWLRSLWPKGWN